MKREIRGQWDRGTDDGRQPPESALLQSSSKWICWNKEENEWPSTEFIEKAVSKKIQEKRYHFFFLLFLCSRESYKPHFLTIKIYLSKAVYSVIGHPAKTWWHLFLSSLMDIKKSCIIIILQRISKISSIVWIS